MNILSSNTLTLVISINKSAYIKLLQDKLHITESTMNKFSDVDALDKFYLEQTTLILRNRMNTHQEVLSLLELLNTWYMIEKTGVHM